ncbi:type I restriction-modification system subunit M [Lactobacillus delbrueckii subsp. lactis]|uniref:class I SAM-dependent DNA methyltransferase n=1 Tax=Lactobacillus delbrueckii TaxID=1584 RepID=UPI000202EFBA|nr:class I SAM-dependent DNA methyltransferase [Lactobacillus delbrueckii]ASW11329.1 SAM-dependent DNA methyltransferase [Lactobacillus delbrueckii subsp. lactis DSM 20072]EGD27637.1 type I restriction-modification system DNA-methyltransferase [Lactobacillus delbrueckii subsp. lactis DSM 20072]MCD5507361.1 type I restriction-modification system subunit M [Lactobacillus delbrueckii subsp. lactis]MCD5520604.1 type I restriction-modification system subunit M [Lactobacillus delbrueckii subsp. lacti
MAVANTQFVKRIQDIMRQDAGINGDAQRIDQISWILFLKVYDDCEKDWEITEDDYQSIIPEGMQWREWAVDNKDGNALTGDELLSFVNNELLPGLKNITVSSETPIKQAIVKDAFIDANNYMKNGVLLRQVINVIDEQDFTDPQDRHMFNDIYEGILKQLQSAGNSGEFYTPRALTDFIAETLQPKLGEKMADFACGTGGFLISTLNVLKEQIKSVEDQEKYNNSVFGIEKKGQPYILAVTNLLLHDVSNPDIVHGNSLEKKVDEYTEKDKFDIIMMNPPFGGSELPVIKQNFPTDLQSSETADLFMALIMYRLKEGGRVGLILPDGFLFGDDGSKLSLKKRLLTDFNLHTIIRLPTSIFAPYTSIATNILFFDKTKPTEKTWFYRLDMPEGYKHFSKTRPMKLEHFDPVREWWNERQEIQDKDGNYKSRAYTAKEIEENGYSLDLCGFPTKVEEVLPPEKLMAKYTAEREELNSKIETTLDAIKALLEEN